MACPAAESPSVLVPRDLLREVIADGCCPLHLRLQLARALSPPTGKEVHGPAALWSPPLWQPDCEKRAEPVPGADSADCQQQAQQQFGEEELDDGSAASGGALGILDRRCLAAVTAFLPFAEVLSVRACSREPLQWAMQRGASDEDGPHHWVHDRLRTRLWMRRIADLTQGTRDESVFETRMRSLADDALRSRMETEMQEALAHMERQIRAFQAEVDRRLEEQDQHVRRLVEERVQQELDQILASEVLKIQAMVEERVRERVSAVFRKEVRETVRELQARLDSLAGENELLRDAFAEANFKAKSVFWALNPPALGSASGLFGIAGGAQFSLRRRLALACNLSLSLTSSSGT